MPVKPPRLEPLDPVPCGKKDRVSLHRPGYDAGGERRLPAEKDHRVTLIRIEPRRQIRGNPENASLSPEGHDLPVDMACEIRIEVSRREPHFRETVVEFL